MNAHYDAMQKLRSKGVITATKRKEQAIKH